jgi:hypothetical protein
MMRDVFCSEYQYGAPRSGQLSTDFSINPIFRLYRTPPDRGPRQRRGTGDAAVRSIVAAGASCQRLECSVRCALVSTHARCKAQFLRRPSTEPHLCAVTRGPSQSRQPAIPFFPAQVY